MSTRKLISQIVVAMRWVDMDAYGHLNHAKFFDLMTEARCDAFKKLIIDYHNVLQLVVVTTTCTFKKPYIYPDNLIIKQYLEVIGQTSFTLYYEFFSATHRDNIHAYGLAKMVCFDPKRRCAVAIPAQLHKALNTLSDKNDNDHKTK